MIFPVLAVRDVDATIQFYVEKLGFSKGMAMPNDQGVTWFGSVSLADSNLGLMHDTETAHRGNGVVLMFYVADGQDIDDVYAAVKGKGVTVTEDIETKFWGDRLFTVTDPDGYVISICKTVKMMSPEEMAAIS